jgi:hypothetical protein
MVVIRVESEQPGAIKRALADSGWLGGERVLAAGQLRQGEAAEKTTVWATLIEVLRPRRSKSLPAHFVLAVTPSRVVAFRATGGTTQGQRRYVLRIRGPIAGEWPRGQVLLRDLPEGARSMGGTLEIGNESIPVSRAKLSGEPDTDELLATLSA